MDGTVGGADKSTELHNAKPTMNGFVISMIVVYALCVGFVFGVLTEGEKLGFWITMLCIFASIFWPITLAIGLGRKAYQWAQKK
jgi:hypothetical protein